MLNKRSGIILVVSFLFLSFICLNQKIVYAADITAPSTTYTVSPSSPDGKNGWYITPVTYTLSATDLESGVKEINYQIDSSPWQKVSFSDTLNLVPNPSFETPDVGSPIYTKYWIKTSPGNSATYTRDTTTYAPGFDTVSIRIDTNAASNWHTISHLNNFAVTSSPYNNMNSSVWIKTDTADAAYYKIFAVTQDQFGQKFYTEILKSAALTGTNDWTKLSNSFTLNVDSAIGVYMEVGVEGKGTAWVDAAVINDSIQSTTTDVSIGTDGIHTLKFYGVDRSENIENTQTVNFKIDQTPPGNWHDSFSQDKKSWRYQIYTTVDDNVSGISPLSNKYQYHTKFNPGFGHYSQIDTCKDPWYSNDWTALENPPFSPGDNSVILGTPITGFCDEDTKVCKTVRFYAEDMAGNSTDKDYCIDPLWVRVSGSGIVGAVAGISLISEPPSSSPNTDGMIEIGNNNLSYFSGVNNWVIKEASLNMNYGYSTFSNLAKSSSPLGSKLPNTSGIYRVSGSGGLTISASTIPNNYDSGSFNAIVFVPGTLTIDTNIVINTKSTLLFIVGGDAKINKSVENVQAGIFADGNIQTAYDLATSGVSKTLYLKGVYSANKIELQRPYQGAGSKDPPPSEDFTYEPKYVMNLADYLGEKVIKWLPATENP